MPVGPMRVTLVLGATTDDGRRGDCGTRMLMHCETSAAARAVLCR